jgi:AraC-like DNA-binding protein
MPEAVDPLSGRLTSSCAQAMREFFAHYEIEIITCAYWRNRAPWRVETRKCFDSFFLFPVIGKVGVTFVSGRRIINPTTYLALPDGVQHSLILEKGYQRLEQIALHCRIQDRWGRPFLNRFDSPISKLHDPVRWHRLLADLASLMCSSDPALGRHLGKVLVSELLFDRLRDEKILVPLNRNSDPRIEHILQRMKDELASPDLSIEALAHGIDLTATQMRKLFRRETRRSPKQYLHRLRLEKAVDLLRHSTQTIKQIAGECGFTTDNYFHLAFRKAFGATPMAFREKEIL